MRIAREVIGPGQRRRIEIPGPGRRYTEVCNPTHDRNMVVTIELHDAMFQPGALPPGTVVEAPQALYWFRPLPTNPGRLIDGDDERLQAYRMAIANTDEPDYSRFADRTAVDQFERHMRIQWGIARTEESIPDHDEQRAREIEEAEFRRRVEEHRIRSITPPPMPAHMERLAQLQRELLERAFGIQRTQPGFDARARRRARILLLRHLSISQRRRFKARGDFPVIGSSSHAAYLIKNSGDVVRLCDEHIFCLQVVGEAVPPEDAMLARKILIESNEELFLSTANDLTARDWRRQWQDEHDEQQRLFDEQQRQAQLNEASSVLRHPVLDLVRRLLPP